MDFQSFYKINEERNENDDWRQKYVYHRTSTGKRNRVKVKSLPSEEQWKYAPLNIRLKRRNKFSKTSMSQPEHGGGVLTKGSRVFTVYYSADRPESFDKFYDGKLVVVTDDSAKAIEIEERGYKIAVAHNVPLDAFIKYWDYRKKDWVYFPKNMDNEKKFEKIKWTDNDVYLCDFFKYKDQIDFQLSDLDNDKESEE